MKVTAVFDIGKTNKKCFLFDNNYQVVFKAYSRFEEVKDEDGYPCDDLDAICQWLQNTLQKILKEEKYEVKAINFSTYGASFVHIDKNGKPLTPLYNYLKPLPEPILQSFYHKYGDRLTIARQTASPPLAMLNSGLQLYWLKYTQTEVFNKIRWSLHLPQYLSFLFTGIPVSEYTSIGCHTALWDYAKNDYHNWVYQEGIDRILPPIVDAGTSIYTPGFRRKIKIGVGIHDSSAALLPYLRADKKPFLLISTGTWSISLNPFNTELLTDEDLTNDCLNFMRINGQAVKAARLFLGHEYKLQVKELQKHFNQKDDAHKKVAFDKALCSRLSKHYSHCFAFETLSSEWEQPKSSQLANFQSFPEAYHQLMLELVELQLTTAKRAIGKVHIQKLYIDGGFADNEVYVQLLAHQFEGIKLRTTQSPLGSALGAAMVFSDEPVKKKFLKKNFALKKHKTEIKK